METAADAFGAAPSDTRIASASSMPRMVWVSVASLSRPFLLASVSIGLKGGEAIPESWLRVLDSPHAYSEIAFEWKIAVLLPCPRSFFQLAYSSSGLLTIIFGARHESIVAFSTESWRERCELCWSHITPEYQHILLQGEYGTMESPDTEPEVLALTAYSGDNAFCIVCFDTRAYINFYLSENLLHLSAHDVYLNYLEKLYEHFEDTAAAADAVNDIYGIELQQSPLCDATTPRMLHTALLNRRPPINASMDLLTAWCAKYREAAPPHK